MHPPLLPQLPPVLAAPWVWLPGAPPQGQPQWGWGRGGTLVLVEAEAGEVAALIPRDNPAQSRTRVQVGCGGHGAGLCGAGYHHVSIPCPARGFAQPHNPKGYRFGHRGGVSKVIIPALPSPSRVWGGCCGAPGMGGLGNGQGWATRWAWSRMDGNGGMRMEGWG